MDIYRVVCSENQQLYPNETFVDFMPAGMNRSENSVIHDSILKMRRLANPDVESLCNGLLLYDFGAGRIELKFEKAYNHIIRRNQENFRKNYEHLIIRRFKEMRESGKDKTLNINTSTLAVVYDFYKKDSNNLNVPQSAREMELRRKAEDYRQQQKRRNELIEKANERSKEERPFTSEQFLAWKMAHYQGD
ncbi:MAG: hypothetical protein IJZ59_06045 [Alphaproteobacteria bacterium]|nr:hypothetical protein [Alphaproteobacteria bacterium]